MLKSKFFDLVLGLVAGFVLLLPVLLVAIAVRLKSKAARPVLV